uniref:Uncharacterized protein n=1 Tax=Thermogemmatispora argillosa TaxID=2045280 RepID=A0A455SWK5_9CHLR|nr:hypothetical protein KTA_02590 [Thermogemmatispora argillosa]
MERYAAHGSASDPVGEARDTPASPDSLDVLLTKVEALLRRPGRLYWIGASPALPPLWFFWPPWFTTARRGRFLETRRAYLQALRAVLARVTRWRQAPDPRLRAEASRLEERLRDELQERLLWYQIRPGPTWPPWDEQTRSSPPRRWAPASTSSPTVSRPVSPARSVPRGR